MLDIASSDARVKAAIAHLGPRFVSNGVALIDFEEVTAQIHRWDRWCTAWSARAAIHELAGREALAREKCLGAGEHLQRAGVYYHFAKFLFVHDLRQMRAAHMKAIECRALALPHLRPPGERLEIPYEGKRLFGILRKPPGVARPPVVVTACGLDSAKEETDPYEQPFLARGLATLVFDGPGQGEGEYDFAIRGDYEVAVKAVIDLVEKRSDIDPSRLGIWGVSLDGYYAPRAAAFEPRIKACIALAGPYDWGDAWTGLPEITREAFRVRSHCATESDARRNAAMLTLKGVARNHHLSDFHHHRQARSYCTMATRGAAGTRGPRCGRAHDYRGRQSCRQHPASTAGGPRRRIGWWTNWREREPAMTRHNMTLGLWASHVETT